MLRAAFLVLALAGCKFDHAHAVGDGGPDMPLDDSRDAADGNRGGPKARMLDIDDTRVSGGPHVDFPLLVSLTTPWLRTTDAGGDVARPDGFDIYFSPDAAGVTKLPHEVELYAPDTGTLIAWVKLPALMPETVLYIHYGDANLAVDPQNVPAVWSGGFEAVVHLDAIADATGKNTQLGATTSGSAMGAVDVARLFDGADDSVDLGSAEAVDDIFAGGGTAEAWLFAQSFGEDSHGRIFDKGHVAGWSLWVNNQERAASLGFLHGTASGSWGFWNTATNSLALNAWHHVALVYNQDSAANDATFYLDGMLATSNVIDIPTGTMVSDGPVGLRAGNRAQLDRSFDGLLDELRLSSAVRSAGWIATEYANQLEPAAFVSAGPEL